MLRRIGKIKQDFHASPLILSQTLFLPVNNLFTSNE
jgi:hypothetical protein